MSSAKYRYWASCPDLTYELASYMPDHAVEVTYRTLRQHVSREAMLMNPWGLDALYRISCPDNWGVQFFRSHLPRGIRTYYLYWSGFEIYFVPGEADIDEDNEHQLAALLYE